MNNNVKAIYCLTPMQEGMLYHKMADENSTSYHIQHSFWINDEIDMELIRMDLDLLSYKHEVLRTAFVIPKSTGIPWQAVLENRKIELKHIVSSDTNESEVIEAVKSQDLERGFDIQNESLFRMTIVTFNPKRHLLLFSNHHIIMDGWSISLLHGDFMRYYKELIKGRSMSEMKQAVTEEKRNTAEYGEYLKWLEKQDNEDGLDYWKELLGDYEGMADIKPMTKPAATERQMESVEVSLSKETTESLIQLAETNNVTINTVAEAAWGIVLQKYNFTNDVVFGKVVSGRNVPIRGIEETVGLFINTIPFRVTCEKGMNVSDLLKVLKKQGIDGINYDYCSLADIQRSVRQGSELIKTLFAFENYYVNEENLKGEENVFELQRESSREQTNYAISVGFELSGGTLNIGIMYNPNEYVKEEIMNILAWIKKVLQSFVADPKAMISEIEIITESDREKILGEFNNTYAEYPKNKTVVDLFEEQVAKTPDNIAVVFKGERLTYAELNAKANSLAYKLRSLGVKADDFVAIITERSIEMIAAIFGILKAGVAYVPMDPTYPEERIQYMLNDCQPKAVLVYNAKVETEIPVIDLSDDKVLEGTAQNPEKVNKPEDLAYCIYTSGTTGQPKGVMVEHKGVVNLRYYCVNTLSITEKDSILLFANIVFDASVGELTMALLTGAKLVILSKEELTNNNELIKLAEKERISAAVLPPIFYTNIEGFAPKTIITGGSEATKRMVEKCVKTSKYVNSYGPTEDTVATTHWECSSEDSIPARIPIGKPIINTKVYILNGVGLCGIGIPGELCMTGVGVARGYLNRPELTAEKFIDNPFGEGKLYRSGDLARWLPDGNIEYLGRIDEQVKMRGFRIEIDEIKSVIRKIEYVKDVAVIAKSDASGDQTIYAYIVSDQVINITELRNTLGKLLPEYMIPSYMIQIDSIPVTRNGKLDKRALPEIETKSEREYAAPRNKTEEILCKIFSEILGVEKVGINDSFFELGGHSLRAIRLVNSIEKSTGERIPLKDIFTFSTVEQLGKLVQNRKFGSCAAIPKAPIKKIYSMSSSQKRLFVVNEIDDGHVAYNMPSVFKYEGILDVPKIEDVINQLIRRHDILRTGFHVVDGEPVQEVFDDIQMHVISKKVKKIDNINLLLDDFVKPFDLAKAPLIRMQVLSSECGEGLLLFDMHHIISDGMSMNILINEFTALYNGGELQPLSVQYKDYSEWMKTRNLSEQENYWTHEFDGGIPRVSIPSDYRRPLKQSFSGKTVSAAINKELRTKINRLTNITGTTDYMVLLSAVMILLGRHGFQEDVIIGTTVSGRVHKDMENILGMFVNTLALRGKPEKGKSFIQFLAEVKETCLKAYENQEYPFEELIDKVETERTVSRNPIFDVMFVLQNNDGMEFCLDGLKLKDVNYENDTAKFDISIVISENAESYDVEFGYCTALYKEDSIKRMLEHYIQLLENVADRYQEKIEYISMTTKDEVKMLLDTFNSTNTEFVKEETLIEMFENQVVNNSEAIAIVKDSTKVTYSQLNNMANCIAKKLREMGISQDERVVVVAERNIETLAGILGVLKAGGAYVPVDTDYPKSRIEYIINDCAAKAVLYCGQVFEFKVDIPEICLMDKQLFREDVENPIHINSTHDLAYIIYTSGTTGQPKGVMVEHSGAMSLREMFHKDYDITEKDVILQFANLTFDASVWEIIMALMTGARLVLIEKEIITDIKKFEEEVIRQGVTVMTLPPQFCGQLGQLGVRLIITAGSEANKKIISRHGKASRYINAYGPTETTICATQWEYHGEDELSDIIPIGKPITNKQVYILNQSELCGIGVPGELCVTGAGIARGYINLPELTADKFVDNPFGEGKLYKTGDFARWLEDGNIEYLGRLDGQIKVRGYRVELSEVENAFHKIDDLKDVAIIADKDESGENVLCAYFTSEHNINLNELRNKLCGMMPAYMVPTHIRQIEKIPVNKNGKLDKNSLPKMDIKDWQTYAGPRNDIEKLLIEVMEEVVHISSIGINDNFYDLGGDSIKAIKFVSNLRERGYSIAVSNILQYQKISDISPLVEKADNLLAEESVSGVIPLGYIQKMFIKWNLKNPNHFNMSVMLEMKEKINKAAMQQAVISVVSHHDMLRVVYKEDRQYVRELNSRDLFNYEVIEMDFSNIKCEADKIQKSMNLETGPLFKVTIFRTLSNEFIHICVHHFVVDGISMRILIEDLIQAYYQYKSTQRIYLAHKTNSFRDWVAHMEKYQKEFEKKEEYIYWRKVNEKIGKVKLDLNSSSNEEKSIGTKYVVLNEKQTSLLIQNTTILNSSVNEALISVAAMTIYGWLGKNEIAVNIEGHGRYNVFSNIAVDRTVGWFTNVYPIITSVGECFKDTLDYVKTALRAVPNNGMGYMLAYDLLEKEKSIIYVPEITVNYLGKFDVNDDYLGDVKISAVSSGQEIDSENTFFSPISINAALHEDKLELNIMYDKSFCTEQDILAFKMELSKNLDKLSADRLESCTDTSRNENNVEIEAISHIDINNIIDETGKRIENYEKNIVNCEIDISYQLSGVQNLSYDVGLNDIMLNIPLYTHISIEKFEIAWHKMLDAYDLLRSSIVINDNERKVIIHKLNKQEKVPFIDISALDKEKRKDVIDRLMTEMACYKEESQYSSYTLTNKMVLVKSSNSIYNFLFTGTHLIFDRFSTSVFKEKLLGYYFEKIDNSKKYSYKNYVELLSVDKIPVSEEEIIKNLNLDEFVSSVELFQKEYKNRNFITYIYEYDDNEEWSNLDEKTLMEISQSIYRKALQFIFKNKDVPVFSINIGRSYKDNNFFEYIGEFLDILPLVISNDSSNDAWVKLSRSIEYVQKNNISFASMLYDERFKKSFPKISKLLNKINISDLKVLIFNYVGLYRESNDIVASSEDSIVRAYITDVVVRDSGLLMKLFLTEDNAIELKEHLDTVIYDMLKDI